MIFKDKEVRNTLTATEKAGQKQELDVAFYLRRAFKTHKSVFVFNDLKITHDEEVAQIDHLILYPFGFILIESKSIKGEVKINQQGEWSRSYQEKWHGIPSPIKQVELQQQLLRLLLHEHKANILSKIFFKQQSFGGRCWDNICAISSNAIIERTKMPNRISQQLVKSEFLCDKIHAIMKLRHPLFNSLNVLDTRPAFKQSELKSIALFLKNNDLSLKNPPQKSTENLVTSQDEDIKLPPSKIERVHESSIFDELSIKKAQKKLILFCAKCGNARNLEFRSGRYGYYLKCNACDGNTPLKRPCPSCKDKNTKVSKRRTKYTLNCLHCQESCALELAEERDTHVI